MVFYAFQDIQKQHRENDDRRDGGVHAGVIGNRSAVGDDIAHTGRGNFQFDEDI